MKVVPKNVNCYQKNMDPKQNSKKKWSIDPPASPWNSRSQQHLQDVPLKPLPRKKRSFVFFSLGVWFACWLCFGMCFSVFVCLFIVSCVFCCFPGFRQSRSVGFWLLVLQLVSFWMCYFFPCLYSWLEKHLLPRKPTKKPLNKIPRGVFHAARSTLAAGL